MKIHRVLALGFAIGSEVATAATGPRPNIVFIIADDMNQYGFLHAHPGVQTPYLDAFRRTAVTFPQAVCNAPSCMPSRASFLSGRYPYSTGAYLNGSDPWNKAPFRHIESLPEVFKRAGYTVWGGGKTFHARITPAREGAAFDNQPHAGGFGPFLPKDDQLTDDHWWGTRAWTGPDTDFPDVVNAAAAIEFLRQPQEKPFFLMLGLWRPHTPFTAPKRFFDRYDQTKIAVLPVGFREDDLADVPAAGRQLTRGWSKRWEKTGAKHPELWRQILWGYLATTTFADETAGQVIAALDARADRDNTIVIFVSDNGYHVGEKHHFEKSTLWSAAANVPFAVRLPGRRNAGTTSRATAALIDIFPTLADYCGLPPPRQGLEGLSLRPVLENPSALWPRPAITVYEENTFSAVDDRYRYIRYADGTEELYDHESDPHEFANLAARSSADAVKQRLQRLIPAKWAPSLGGREGKLALNGFAPGVPTIRLRGLDEQTVYRVTPCNKKLLEKQATLSEAYLMSRGLNFELVGEFDRTSVLLAKVEQGN